MEPSVFDLDLDPPQRVALCDEWSEMLSALTIIFALLALGAGFAVARQPSGTGVSVWDVLLIGSTIAFLACFVRLIAQTAAETFEETHDSHDEPPLPPERAPQASRRSE